MVHDDLSFQSFPFLLFYESLYACTTKYFLPNEISEKNVQTQWDRGLILIWPYLWFNTADQLPRVGLCGFLPSQNKAWCFAHRGDKVTFAWTAGLLKSISCDTIYFTCRNSSALSKYREVLVKSHLVRSGSPAVYQLKPTTEFTGGVNSGCLFLVTLGKKDVNETNKMVLLVGETGAGKSALVNTLVNYAMRVTWVWTSGLRS